MSSAGARARATTSRAMAHPVHQAVARRHRAAVTDAVTLYGWRLTELGHVDSAGALGPCALCRKPIVRYGMYGKPLCGRCGA